MTCEDCRSGLVLYVSGQLPATEESATAGHLRGCDACRGELEAEIRFARSVHNASIPFREATARLGERPWSERSADPVRRVRVFSGRAVPARAVLAASLSLCILAAFFMFSRAHDRDIAHVSSWAVDHYALVDQTHPLHGNAEAVRAWFREHHQIDVTPPRDADYSTLAGCKMAEIDSEPAPLLRFEGTDTSAIFMLPSGFRQAAGAGAGTYRKGGYVIRIWSEGGSPFLKIMRVPTEGKDNAPAPGMTRGGREITSI